MSSEYKPQTTRTPPGPSLSAARFYEARLRFETDPSEVASDMKAGMDEFTVLDVRNNGAYEKAHVPGAINIPFDQIDEESAELIPQGLVVTYCWGPACNGSKQAAAKLAAMGRPVKEMVGGWEYWVREGHPIEGRGSKPRSFMTSKPWDDPRL